MSRPPSTTRARVPVPDEGCTILSAGGPSPMMDVVFVHGLGGHPKSTWTSKAREPKASAEPKPSLVVRARGMFRSIRSASATREGTGERAQSAAQEDRENAEVQEERGSLDGGSEQEGVSSKVVYWPEDLLAKDCPDMRILTYGYDSQVTKFFGTVPHHNLLTLGRDLLRSIADERAGCPTRPLLFICHSLGGILVKQSLVLAQTSSGSDAYLTDIRKHTVGVIFFGTPHSGSPEASLAQSATDIVGVLANKNPMILDALNVNIDNGQLEQLRSEFNKMLGSSNDNKFWVQSFRELKPMVPHIRGQQLVVPLFSSAIDNEWESKVEINKNHIDMCKFGGKEDKNYQATIKVVTRFRQTVQEKNTTQGPSDQDVVQLVGPGHFKRDFEKFLESLKIPRSRFIGSVSSGTCEWIYLDELFIKWQEDESGIFRIQGNAGTGKSTLMRHLVTREISTNVLSQKVITSFSFFDSGDDLEKSMLGFIRSLLHQIFQQAPRLARPAMREFLKQRRSDNSNIRYWDDLKTLKDVTTETLKHGSGYQVCLFIDALDECRFPSFRENIQFLSDMVGKSAPGMAVKMCFSSRPHALISHAFRDVPTKILEDHNASDIQRFIDNQVASIGPLDASYQVVWGELSRKAQGVFMWVRLVLTDFILDEVERHILYGDKLSPEQLLDMIGRMHPDLREMYTRMLRKIERRDHDESARTLQLVLCAARPLSLEEFTLAWAFGSVTHDFASEKDMKASPDFSRDDNIIRNQIWRRGGGLIEVKTSDDGVPRVHLIHQTVRDYLKDAKDCERIFDSLPSLPNGHEILVRACTSYLSIFELRFLRIFFCREAPSFYHAVMIIRETYKFFTYAATYWIVHVRRAEATTQHSQAAPISNDHARRIALYHGLGIPIITQDEISIGLEDFWGAWVSIRGVRDAHENVRGNPGPLSVASACNLIHSVKDMLENGADINEAGGFPIQAAAHGQHHEMLLLLLDRGASIQGLARKRPLPHLNLQSDLWTPLRLYCALSPEPENDENEKRAVSLLLDGGLERISAEETSPSSILCLAALCGKALMVTNLLERSKSMPQHEQYAMSALLALIVIGTPQNHSNATACFIAVLDSLDNAVRRRCLNRTLGWIAQDVTEQYLATFLLEQRLKLDAETECCSQEEIQVCSRIILADGPFNAIRSLKDVPVEAVPTLQFNTEEPEMAEDEVHIFCPGMKSQERQRWLRKVANETSTPGVRPRLQIFL